MLRAQSKLYYMGLYNYGNEGCYYKDFTRKSRKRCFCSFDLHLGSYSLLTSSWNFLIWALKVRLIL